MNTMTKPIIQDVFFYACSVFERTILTGDKHTTGNE